MDQETKELLALGDNETWSIFHSKYEAHIKKIITNRTSDKNYILDLVNEVFVIIFNAIERFNIDYPEENWISKIAVFHCINHHRKQKSTSKKFNNFEYVELETYHAISKHTHEDKLIADEKLKDIKNTFKHFSYMEKKILICRLFKGYKYNEIENELNVNISTVKNTIRKHRKHLNFILN